MFVNISRSHLVYLKVTASIRYLKIQSQAARLYHLIVFAYNMYKVENVR